MARKNRNTVYTSVHPNAVVVRGSNKQVDIVRLESDVEFAASNVIFIKSLTANTGKKPGVKHNLSDNEKIKYSALGLSDEAIIELYMGLSHYVKRIINNQTK